MHAHSLIAETLAAVAADGSVYADLAVIRGHQARALLLRMDAPELAARHDDAASAQLERLALRVGERIVEGPRP